MKGSIIIVSFFIAGVLLGRFVDIPAILTAEAPTLYALYILMFLVGISIGSDKKALQALKQQNLKIVLVPMATVIGTLIGSALISFLLSGRSITGLPCRGIQASDTTPFPPYSLPSTREPN